MKEIIKNILNQFKISNKVKVLSISLIINVALFLALIFGIIYFKLEYNSSEGDTKNILNNNELENFDGMSLNENNKIIIHIAGEINNPGVYELEEKSRISDAIKIAGGISENANLENVNLAYELQDGQKIKIPSIKDVNNANNNDESKDEIITDGIDDEIIQDSNSLGKKININKAVLSDLTKLPGIGESTAKKILDYKKQNGNFNNIDEIKNIPGIGESKYNQIKDYIKVK